jgi:effector-binding domain-containing protein
MLEPIRIVKAKAQIAAVVHLTIPRQRAQQEIPRAIEEVLAAVSSQGLRTVSPLFTHHLKIPSHVFDLDVGFPVSEQIAPAGRVKSGELPAAQLLRAVYHGGYEGLSAAWSEFGKRAQTELVEELRNKRLRPGETSRESYIKGPESDPDPGTWRTELNRPLN